MTNSNIQKCLQTVKFLKGRVLKSLESAPEGSLRCEMSRRKYPQYYLIDRKKNLPPKGRYLKKKEIELAQALAQKGYDKRVLKVLRKQEDVLEKCAGLQEITESVIQIYEKLPEAKKRLVTPYVFTDEEYVKRWLLSFETGGNSIKNIEQYITEKGEVVRSKSEKMIADKLFYLGIPYIYEPTLRLPNGGIIFPDFVLLSLKTREDYYLEHFGMMDSSEYCKKAIQKLEKYTENGIFPGEKLLLSFESSQKGINMRQIELILNKYLL